MKMAEEMRRVEWNLEGVFCRAGLLAFALRDAIAATAIKNEVVLLHNEIGRSRKIAILDPLMNIKHLAARTAFEVIMLA